MASPYPPELIDAVRQLAAAKKSMSDVACELSTPYRVLTRNAVAGLASRLGIVFSSNGRRKFAPRAQNPRHHYVRKPAYKPAAEHVGLRVGPELTLKPEVIAERPATDPTSLLDLRADQCRWPVNDLEPFMFCGGFKIGGSSYCRSHFHASRAPRREG